MKTIIKIFVAAVLLHAVAQGAWASWRYYQFKDAVEQELLFSERTTPEVIQTRVVELAQEYEVPLKEDAVQVSRQGIITRVNAVYTEQVTLVPRLYEPVWTWNALIQVRSIR